MLTPIQNLYYAIGELAYAVAFADGTVQKEEKQKFHEILVSELKTGEQDFDVSEIIFHILDKGKQDEQFAYESAMKEIKLNSHYLSPGMKDGFIRVMERVAEIYPPKTPEEADLIKRFRKDIEPIAGDPVYYR